MKMIGISLIFILALHSLVIMGLLGYGLATNRFDAEKRQQYLATWRGDKLIPPPDEEEKTEETDAPQEASTRLLNEHLEREILTREMRQFAQLLRDKQNAIKLSQLKLQQDIEEFQAQKQEFEQRVENHNEQVREEGFQKALENYTRLNPKLVKEDFMKMPTEDAVRYLSAMKATKAAEILDRFKTPEEMSKRLQIMQMMEEYGAVDVQSRPNQPDAAGTM